MKLKTTLTNDIHFVPAGSGFDIGSQFKKYSSNMRKILKIEKNEKKKKRKKEKWKIKKLGQLP